MTEPKKADRASGLNAVGGLETPANMSLGNLVSVFLIKADAFVNFIRGKSRCQCGFCNQGIENIFADRISVRNRILSWIVISPTILQRQEILSKYGDKIDCWMEDNIELIGELILRQNERRS